MIEHYEKLKNMYNSAKINKCMYESSKIIITNKRSEISLLIDKKYYHPLNSIHGSIYFKLLDDAAYFAVSSVVKDFFVLTLSFDIHIIRAASKGEIKSVGNLNYQSRNHFVAESTLFNEENKEIAFGRGSFTRSKYKLVEEVGYI